MNQSPASSKASELLNRLETAAKAATPGPWAYQEDSDAYTHIVRPVASPGWIIASATQTSKPEGEANGRWIAEANPAAVLELIALARKGIAAEAPDAEAAPVASADYADPTIACSGCGLTMGESRTLGHIKLGILAAPAPQAAPVAPDVLPPPLRSGIACAIEAEIDAQLNASGMCPADMQRQDGYAVLDIVLDAIAARQAMPVADSGKGDALWQATMRACSELPDGYEVRIELENGCGMAVWYDPEGERHVIDGDGDLADEVNEAVDAALSSQHQNNQGEGG